jgi:hypothetical protein
VLNNVADLIGVVVNSFDGEVKNSTVDCKNEKDILNIF